MFRVAYIVDHLQIGGAQKHLLRVVEGLDRDQFTPEIWTASDDPGELADEFRARDTAVHAVGIRDSMMRPATLRSTWEMSRELRRHKVDIVHGYLFEGNFLAALARLFRAAPVTFVAKRSLDLYTRRDRRLAAAFSNRVADQVVVNAGSVGELVRTHEWCPPSKILEIPNGVEFPSAAVRRPLDPARPTIGMVGRLGWKKGYEFALEAFAALRKLIPGLQVEIVGEGNLRDELLLQRHALDLEDCVQFLGRRNDVPALLPRWDVYLLSSVIEGMPNAHLEAMAAGLPVVSTRAGGCDEIIEDGVSGLLADTHDAAGLADALERVLTDPQLAASLSGAGRKRVEEHYSLDAMIGSMQRAYRASLQDAGFKIPANWAEKTVDSRNSGSPLLENASRGNI